jgi:hypothetical protein
LSDERRNSGGPGGGSGGNGPVTARVDISRTVAHELGRAVSRAGYLAVETGDNLTILGDTIEGHTTARKRAIVLALLRELEDAKGDLAAVIDRCDDATEMVRRVAEDMTLELANANRR